MTRKTIKGLVFDKDGTLFDFNATWGAWARQVFEAEAKGDPERVADIAQALGYNLDSERFEAHSIVIAGTNEETAQAALPHLDDTAVEDVLARWNTIAAEAPQVEAAPLAALLRQLRSAGLVLGVATNDAEAPARAHLQSAGVETSFDFIAGFDSGHGGKPAPGQLLAFCAAVGLDPAHCAMVGDSTHDLRAGRAAGMTCVAVLTGVAKAPAYRRARAFCTVTLKAAERTPNDRPCRCIRQTPSPPLWWPRCQYGQTASGRHFKRQSNLTSFLAILTRRSPSAGGISSLATCRRPPTTMTLRSARRSRAIANNAPTF